LEEVLNVDLLNIKDLGVVDKVDKYQLETTSTKYKSGFRAPTADFNRSIGVLVFFITPSLHYSRSLCLLGAHVVLGFFLRWVIFTTNSGIPVYEGLIPDVIETYQRIL